MTAVLNERQVEHVEGSFVAPVAIVGGGPVGLSLALGLARQGVRSILLERKPSTSKQSKAPAIHVRTREIFRQWGIEARFLEAGILRETLTLHAAAPGRSPLLFINFADLDDEADHPGLLILEQGQTEKLLLEAVQETGLCDVRFAAEVVELVEQGEKVRLTVDQAGTDYSVEAEFVVGCDGASSFVRGALGLPFEGHTYSIRPMLADVLVKDARDALPWPRIGQGDSGLTAALRLNPGHWRIIRLEPSDAKKSDDVPDEEMRRRVDEVLGPGPVDVIWASRFRIHLRSSPRFRVGRVLLAGDAAHIHSPAGGLGMNGGIQDAHNLAWKLAYALRGGDVERLLDSYDVERRAVMVESVSTYTDAVTRVFLQTPPRVRNAAFALTRWAFKLAPVRRRSLRRGTMIDLEYGASPLLNTEERAAGIRLPNVKLRSPEGADVRLYDLLPGGPVILEVAEDASKQADLPMRAVIQIGPAGYFDPTGALRSLLDGQNGWILVRPDSYIAWARTHLEGMGEAMGHALGIGRVVMSEYDLPAAGEWVIT